MRDTYLKPSDTGSLGKNLHFWPSSSGLGLRFTLLQRSHIQIQDQSEKLALRLEEIPLEIQHTRNWQILKTKVNGIRLDNLLRLRYEAFILSIETASAQEIVHQQLKRRFQKSYPLAYSLFAKEFSLHRARGEKRPTLASHHFRLLQCALAQRLLLIHIHGIVLRGVQKYQDTEGFLLYELFTHFNQNET